MRLYRHTCTYFEAHVTSQVDILLWFIYVTKQLKSKVPIIQVFMLVLSIISNQGMSEGV